MKKILLLMLAGTMVCHANLVPFALSPAGSSAAVGLSPQNVVPAVTNSTGSGGPISGGIVFDTATFKLHFAVGYGLSAGFSNLTGPATGMGIRGPAGTNQSAGELINLLPYSFPAVNPAAGGVIFSIIDYPTNAVMDLFAGSNYVSLFTGTNLAEEIRGQLVMAAPTVSCSQPTTVECGTIATVSVLVIAPKNGVLTVVWSVNGTSVQTNLLPASTSPIITNLVFAADLPLGTNIVGVSVSDSANNTDSCSTTVTVVDTIAPVITAVSVTPKVLWPPNHKMVTATVSAVVTDNCGATWKIIRVQSNEAKNGLGDGNTAVDWQITGDHTVDLRAERSGKGSGRVYSIHIQATDQAGNVSAIKTVTVKVPKSQGKK